MNRQEKEQAIQYLKDRLAADNASSFVVSYKGLTVEKMQALRNQLRGEGAELKVAKARLMKLAVQDTACQELQNYLQDQIALVLTTGDFSSVAKSLTNFAKDNEALDVLAGCFEEKVYGEQDVVAIAKLPSREVLLAMVCGTLQAPITGYVRVLNQLITRLLYVLQRIAEQKK